ncbi:MAG: type IV toxin-antitoxin system AbiEi family antitoxin domain-containing protein [Planctomycetota bacterium]
MADVPTIERVLKLAREAGTVTTRQIVAVGVHRQVLTRLVETGQLVRISRGVYALPEHPVTESHGLALVAASVPDGVVCLISALAYHGIGTQLPHEVWIALDRRAHRPTLEYPPLRVVRFTGEALTEGVEEHPIEGRSVRIYCAAKTIADSFKYRNKIGIEVALEALREGWKARAFTMDQIERYAAICRVERVMKPYLEALVG